MYEVKTLDLAAAFTNQEISEPTRRIAEIICFDLPGGASFQLRVGKNSDWITISRGFSMEPTGDQEANFGLYVRNGAAQAGVTVEIVLVYGDAQLSTLLT